jgi:hypothetical protein
MLNAKLAAVLRDAGVDQVSKTQEFEKARVFVWLAAAGQREITSDDAWKGLESAGITRLNHPNTMGAAFRAAATGGLIRPTGRIRKSCRVSGHRRNVQVWESQVFQGEPR